MRGSGRAGVPGARAGQRQSWDASLTIEQRQRCLAAVAHLCATGGGNTAVSVSVALGLGKDYVSRVRVGTQTLTADFMQRVAGALQTTVEDVTAGRWAAPGRAA